MITSTGAGTIQNIEQSIQRVVAVQQANKQNLKNTSAKERINKLKSLRKWIELHQKGIQEALYADLQKSPVDTDITEIYPVKACITHTITNLRRWMKPRQVPTPIHLLFTQSKVYYEPKGVALIIAPWNYPFQLMFDPLVYAIAAGCPAILKPSEVTPHTSAYIKKMVKEFFPEKEVAVFEGDAEVAKNLLRQPFDHIFFTGSPSLGKQVMKTAAENLSSLTLELGGKSPVIIDKQVNLKDAAQKITWGKFLNCGQTCIAPDYVLIHEDLKAQFIKEIKNNIQIYYGQGGKISVQDSPDYGRIVNKKHFYRIKALVDDVLEQGGEIEAGGQMDVSENFIAPTILSNLHERMQIMEEEIFGPLLPVISYRNLSEALQFMERQPKPLALYIFSNSKKTQQFILQNTTAGGSCINEVVIHIANTHLPFGGVNQSGLGKTHGRYGFLAFTNIRSVLKQRVGWTGLKLMYPPYTTQKKKLVRWMGRWL